MDEDTVSEIGMDGREKYENLFYVRGKKTKNSIKYDFGPYQEYIQPPPLRS